MTPLPLDTTPAQTNIRDRIQSVMAWASPTCWTCTSTSKLNIQSTSKVQSCDCNCRGMTRCQIQQHDGEDLQQQHHCKAISCHAPGHLGLRGSAPCTGWKGRRGYYSLDAYLRKWRLRPDNRAIEKLQPIPAWHRNLPWAHYNAKVG
jgi:hypothetical protein